MQRDGDARPDLGEHLDAMWSLTEAALEGEVSPGDLDLRFGEHHRAVNGLVPDYNTLVGADMDLGQALEAYRVDPSKAALGAVRTRLVAYRAAALSLGE